MPPEIPRVPIPPALAGSVVDAWGADGAQWLEELPGLVELAVRDWELEAKPGWHPERGAPYPMSFHWVGAATQPDGTEVVLKLGPAKLGHLTAQAAALRAFAGHGAVRLIAYDADRGALLLEQAHPGTLLRTLVDEDDEQATAVVIDVTHRLHAVPPPTGSAGELLPDLIAERASFERYLRENPANGPLPRELVDRAANLFVDLCADAPRVLLHGDLHHDNILRSEREGWLAIDPFGIRGDPAFEAGPMLYNPDPERHDDRLLGLVPARIEQLADGLSQPVERIVAWGFVMAMLSEVWTTEGDGVPGGRPLDVARLLVLRLP
jgi:streptomycin 6-kinase